MQNINDIDEALSVKRLVCTYQLLTRYHYNCNQISRVEDLDAKNSIMAKT